MGRERKGESGGMIGERRWMGFICGGVEGRKMLSGEFKQEYV